MAPKALWHLTGAGPFLYTHEDMSLTHPAHSYYMMVLLIGLTSGL